MKSFFQVTGVFLLAVSAGCAHKYEQNHMTSSHRRGDTLVAVMPFQGVSESPGSGLIVADVMANELLAYGGYVVVTPEVVAARAAAREGEVLSPEETGRLIGAPYILTGRVTEYTYKSGVGEQPAVGVTARLIETSTGRVLWSATRARTGSAAWFQEDSLSLLTSRICRHLVQSLHGEAKLYGYGSARDEYVVQEHPTEAMKKAAEAAAKKAEEEAAKKAVEPSLGSSAVRLVQPGDPPVAVTVAPGGDAPVQNGAGAKVE